MGGDEAELIAAGEEADEDQRCRTDRGRRGRSTVPMRLLQLGLRRAGAGARSSGRASSDSRIAAAKITKTVCQGMTLQQHLGQRRADDLAGRAGGRGDAERHRAVLRRGGAADDGEDDAEAGAGDAEADQDVRGAGAAPGVTAKLESTRPGGIEQRAEDDRLAVAEAFGDARRRSAGRCPRRGSGWRWPSRNRRAASRTRRRSGSGTRRSWPGSRSDTIRMTQPADQDGRDEGGFGHGRLRFAAGRAGAAGPDRVKTVFVMWTMLQCRCMFDATLRSGARAFHARRRAANQRRCDRP